MFQEDFTLDISIWRPETDTLVTDATNGVNRVIGQQLVLLGIVADRAQKAMHAIDGRAGIG